MELTPKQENFCRFYIETGNASEAYRRAYDASGMKDAVIHVKASELLDNGKITVRIAELQADHRKRHEVTVDRLVQELASIAFANSGDYFEWGPTGVRVKPSSELTAQQRAVVCEVSQTVTDKGGTIRVKLSDKQAAIDKLAKHLGMFVERKEVGAPGAFADMENDELNQSLRDQIKDIAAEDPEFVAELMLANSKPRRGATKH